MCRERIYSRSLRHVCIHLLPRPAQEEHSAEVLLNRGYDMNKRICNTNADTLPRGATCLLLLYYYWCISGLFGHAFDLRMLAAFCLSPYILLGEKSPRFCDVAEAAKCRGVPRYESTALRIASSILLLSPCRWCRRRRSCFSRDRRWAQRGACRASTVTLLRGSTQEA